MFDIIQHSQDAIGLGGTVKMLSALSAEDRAALKPGIMHSFPEELIDANYDNFRLGLVASFARLVRVDHARHLVMLGTETVLIDVASSLQIDMSLEVLTSPNLTARDTEVLRASMPPNLSSVVHPAGVLPLNLPVTATVIAIALKSSDEQLLITDTAAQMLGALRGMRFLGDLHAISPFEDRFFTAPPRGWQTISNSEFRSISTPEQSVKFAARI